jgi:phage FluMu protein Com
MKTQSELLEELDNLGYALAICPECSELQIIETENETTRCFKCDTVEETIFFNRRA